MIEPIIINESPTPYQLGCVYLFGSLAAAEKYFEPWYADESYYACDGAGCRLQILPNETTGGVRIVEYEGGELRPDLSASFMRSYIASLPALKGLKKLGKSEEWLRSSTLLELAAASVQLTTCR